MQHIRHSLSSTVIPLNRCSSISHQRTCSLREPSSKLTIKYFSTKPEVYRNQGVTSNTNVNEPHSLLSLSCKILRTPNPSSKVELSAMTKSLWLQRKIPFSNRKESTTSDLTLSVENVPITPSRPEKPILVSPKKIPSHKTAGVPLPIYLLHGLAHIELNAIDMVWDMIARFKHIKMPDEFYDEWVHVADDEARHFAALANRLEKLGSSYGALLAHDSLWKNAERTVDNLKARIAVMQLVQEARALDAHPRLLQKVSSGGDKESMRLVDTICKEEVEHVRKGVKWFKYLCEQEGVDPVVTFHDIAKKYVDTKFPPPFNVDARNEAGMHPDYYMPLAINVSS